MNKFIKDLFMILILSLLFSYSLFADDAEKWAGNIEMNGIKFESYKNFSEKWKQVTVRYRQDTGEFRYTYANEKAYRSLEKGEAYPDGAEFLKVAYKLVPDPAFPSSLVPSNVTRYQIMSKNSKNKTTDGWTYALFDNHGQTFPGNPQEIAISCHSCHELVKDKRYVFSEILNHESKRSNISVSALSKLKFVHKKASELPAQIKALLPSDMKEISFLSGNLRDHVFEGTLDEVKPALAQEVVRTKRAALFLSKDLKQYSLMTIDSKSKCEKTDAGKIHGLKVFFTITPRIKDLPPQIVNKEGLFATLPFCYVEIN